MPEPENRRESFESAVEAENRCATVLLFVRFWAYVGPAQPLSGLAVEQEPQIAKLLSGVIREAKGVIAEQQHPTVFSACFDDAVRALSAAKVLQQRFLAFHQETQPQQIVPSVLISSAKNPSTPSTTEAANVLDNFGSAQILVADSVYEMVKSMPGPQFNPKPVREAGPTGVPEALYELLWTDESTYGHLRQAVQSRLNKIGRYQIQEELGRGAMGAVYKAYDELIGRTVALKVISIDRNTPDRVEVIERLKQEAKAAGNLDHPNIITIYDVGQEEDVVYLSMQFLEGKTLLKFLSENGVPALPTLISWADQICSAVDYAHANGVIHRDLKPANLMLTKQGTTKVLDFGIAKVESSSLTQTGLIVGTPSYMAPEQVAGKKVDQRADIFSLGSVFYELVTREKPFRGDITTVLYKIVYEEPVAPSLINPALPGGIDAIIRKALAKDPEERFQSCEEMRNAFLEQAALLNISPMPSLAAANAPVKSTAPAPAAFSLHLLEDSYTERTRYLWPAITAIVVLILTGVAGRAFYSWSHTGSLPETAARMKADVQGLWQELRSRASSFRESPGDQSHSASGEIAGENRTAPGHSLETNSNSSPAAATGGAQPAPTALQTDALTNSLAKPSPAQPPGNQPGSDGSQVSAGPVSDAVGPGPTQAPQSLSITDRRDTGPTAVAQQQNDNDQSSSEDASHGTEITAEDSARTSDGDEEQAPAQGVSSTKRTRPEAAVTVDGFTRHDVPELLRQADAAARRSDYRLANYEYKLILKLEPGNATARAGLRRVQAVEH
ncbi:MAG TPA: protein kinase [Terriglobales bacterium]